MPNLILSCVFCNVDDSRFLYHIDDIFNHKHGLHKCNKCGTFFLSPRPDAKMLKFSYDATYYGEHDEKFNLFVEIIFNVFRRKRARKLSKHLKDDDRILDIGCGNGRFLQYMLKFGRYQLYGTELDGNSALRTSRINEINLKIGDLKQEDYPEKYFKVITLFHVFEHLINPSHTLSIISKLLKKDGVLVMSFPNIDSFQSRFFKDKWLHLDPPRHLFYLKRADLIIQMKKYGFELIETTYFSIEQNPFGMIQSILNRLCKNRDLLYERLKGNKNYCRDYSEMKIILQKLFFVFSFPLFIFSDILFSLFKKSATFEMIFRKID